ncbi:hypothetical protein [Mobilicoccus caccae]|uniref:Uncharacterized protein n=1 Tax=Mobilicoccus caccae TaxID=1859295 RepID=A0ABQ6IW71_9MICO|nr:hypothetical protein [Mobilicoccus caccae]GMA40964.1 hypothetical protein GCM10025883_30090 [Mobilicoccus caccae]
MSVETTQETTVATTPKTAVTWTCTLGGRFYELDVTPGLSTRTVLRVDGQQVHDEKVSGDRRTITLDADRRVEVRLSSLGKVRRATVHDGPVDLDFDAPAGSRAARTQEWGRTHPTLFALRHVVIKGGVIVVALLGLGALVKAVVEPVVRWIAERMPDIPLPDIDLPDIPWPSIPRPDITPPDWLAAFLTWFGQYDHIVKPLLIGLAIALFEIRRQRRQRRLRDSATADSPDEPPTAGDRGAPAP